MLSEFDKACRSGDIETVRVLLKQDPSVTKGSLGQSFSLGFACYYGRFEIVKLLVNHGENIHENTNYAVIAACGQGHLEIVKYLIKHGANIRVRNDVCLHHAAQSGYLNVVKYLVNLGLKLDSKELVWIANVKGNVSTCIYLSQFCEKQKFSHENFECFYILITSFYNKQIWTKNTEIKQDYLFDPNVSLIVASYVWK